MALFAQARLILPWTPVPITGQTLGVLFVGAMLGARSGSKAVMAYILAGAAGLPVFAGFAGGLAWLLGPTGGYIIGFLPAVWIMGLAADRNWLKSPWKTGLAIVAAHSVIYAMGCLQLGVFVPRPVELGVLPFLLPDALKALAAIGMIKAGDVLLRR